MAATIKADLLKITRKEYDKLSKLIAPIAGSQALVKTGEVKENGCVPQAAIRRIRQKIATSRTALRIKLTLDVKL